MNYSVKASAALEKFIKENKINTANLVTYSYWFYEWALVLSISKRKKIIKSYISRTHMGDLYYRLDNRRNNFQNVKLSQIKELHVISEHGSSYLAKNYPSYVDKLKLTYLGSLDYGVNADKKEGEDEFVILSCSKLDPLRKRVHLIPDILKHLDFKVKWIHFGSDSEQNQIPLKQALNSLPNNVSVELKGHCEKRVILDYYTNNHVDLFINVSNFEGLPVGMIEAISFGVPLLATKTNGSPELVKDEIGVLIPIDFDAREIAQIVRDIKQQKIKLNREEARKYFKSNFSSEINYENFTNNLLEV